MSDSFGAVTLQVATTPHARDGDSDTTIRHIPGGSVTYADLAGPTAETLQLGLWFSGGFADYSAFSALRGTSATLTYVDAPSGITAILRKCRIQRRYPSGPIEATADFVLA